MFIAYTLAVLVASLLIATPLLALLTEAPHARLVVQLGAVALVCATGAEFALVFSRALHRTNTLVPVALGLNALRAGALVLVVVELGDACRPRSARRPGYADFGVVAIIAWLVYLLRPFAPFTFYAPS